MILLSLLPPLSTWIETLFDSTFLVILISSPLYLFLFRPLIQHIEKRKQAEEELRESEAQFRSLIESAPSVILSLSTDGRILEFNPEAESIYGYKREDVLNQDYLKVLFPKEIQEEVAAKVAKVLEGEKIRSFENVIMAADGEERTLSWNVDPLIDNQSKTAGIIAIGLDITERKRMEDTLRRLVGVASSQFGKAFFDTMAVQLSETLNADYTLIGELQKGKRESIKTIAISVDGELADNIEYELAKTPCENVVGKEVCSYASGVWELFPEDMLLKEMGVEGYVGVPLFDSQGSPLGIMVALFRKPLTDY